MNFKNPSTIATSVAAGLLLLIIAIMAINGFYTVKPGEAAAVRVFGEAAAEPVTSEGLHWNWPGPIGKTDVVQTQKIRNAEIGFRYLPEGEKSLYTGEGWEARVDEATMITGDLNLVEVQLVAQYYIGDLHKYLFEADDPGLQFQYTNADSKTRTHTAVKEGRPDGRTIRDALEVALRRAAGQRTIDEVLITQREVIESETKQVAQERLDKHRTGLVIASVQLQEVKAPDVVQAAFDDVLRAREERDTKINQALALEQSLIPEAKGQASQLVNEATAEKQRSIKKATAEADRFLNIYNEYKRNPEIIRTRMWLDTLDQVLPNVNLVMLLGDDPPPVILDAGGNPTRRIVPTP